MTDAEREATELMAEYHRTGLYHHITEALKQAEQRGREENEQENKKWHSRGFADGLIEAEQRGYDRYKRDRVLVTQWDGYKEGLLRAAEIAENFELTYPMITGPSVAEAIRKEAEQK